MPTIRRGQLLRVLLAAGSLCAVGAGCRAAEVPPESLQRTVNAVIRPLMAKDDVPGMAVGVTVDGKNWVFNYGVKSRQSLHPVDDRTLFELGSVSKTFTATLVGWAQSNGRLALSDAVDKYWPALQGKPFGRVSLLNLDTHTPGVLPLQLPETIHSEAQLLQYLAAWRPSCTPGTCRTYNNIGIGSLGLIAAKSLGGDFPALMTRQLFPALGLHDSFLNVPPARMSDYAQGYSKQNQPVRVTPALLAEEAYGVKSTAADMLRFINLNMQSVKVDKRWTQAIAATHRSYFRVGGMTQDLIWEQYPYPVSLDTLLAGNASAMAYKTQPATAITPPGAPSANAWINKTGSTNGFGAYVAYVPALRLGIVILANRNIPIDDRVVAAQKIIASLAH
jgi:beta-lactamase class C